MPRVHFQAPLTQATGGKSLLQVKGRNVSDLIERVEADHGGLKKMIFNSQGQLHRHIIISVNEEDIRFLEGFETVVTEDDEVSILPVIAGG